MENFDSFTPYLESCLKIENFRILGIEGNFNEWGGKTNWYRGTEYEYQNFKERKNESSRWVGTITIFDERNYTHSQKTLYRNTKGVYFKGKEFEKNVYILKELLPEKMKLS